MSPTARTHIKSCAQCGTPIRADDPLTIRVITRPHRRAPRVCSLECAEAYTRENRRDR